jgi:mRNA interferase RelE/StbE
MLEFDILFWHILPVKKVLFTRDAGKQLRRLPATAQADILAKLDRYVETGAGNVTKLVNQPGVRLRVGDYRAIFIEAEAEISVIVVGHRRDIYR